MTRRKERFTWFFWMWILEIFFGFFLDEIFSPSPVYLSCTFAYPAYV